MKRTFFAILIFCILFKVALAEATIVPNFYGGEIKGVSSTLQLGEIYFFSTSTSSKAATASSIPISEIQAPTTSTTSTTILIPTTASFTTTTTTVSTVKETVTTTTRKEEIIPESTSSITIKATTTTITTTTVKQTTTTPSTSSTTLAASTLGTSTTTTTTLMPATAASPSIPTTTTTTTTTIKRTTGPVSVIGQPIHFPSPYSPTKNALSGLTIQYELSNDADIDIYVFSVAGGMVKKISCYAGNVGGSYGLNQVKWDGIPDQGGRLGNGMYATTIVARKEGRLLAKFKINVFD